MVGATAEEVDPRSALIDLAERTTNRRHDMNPLHILAQDAADAQTAAIQAIGRLREATHRAACDPENSAELRQVYRLARQAVLAAESQARAARETLSC
jgi:hypothetical protein